MPADYFNARCYATRRTLPSLPTMNHTVTNPIKLSLHSFRGWRISPRKRPDGRWHDGARSISRSSKSIDRKEEISKMIINTSIIARFQFHPRYRSLLRKLYASKRRRVALGEVSRFSGHAIHANEW